jgi:hypothetical protein
MTVKLELTEEEAEWLAACLGLVMHLARKWDDRTANDLANHTLAKLTMARTTASVADPDEYDRCFVCRDPHPTSYYQPLCKSCMAWLLDRNPRRRGYAFRAVHALSRYGRWTDIRHALSSPDEELLECRDVGRLSLAWLRSVDDWPEPK